MGAPQAGSIDLDTEPFSPTPVPSLFEFFPHPDGKNRGVGRPLRYVNLRSSGSVVLTVENKFKKSVMERKQTNEKQCQNVGRSRGLAPRRRYDRVIARHYDGPQRTKLMARPEPKPKPGRSSA